ncbi:sensor histidine kinase [Bifidobacterium callitrichos]|uniref:sensor histidine kinase n=1 Tax=Bifidobacterium callitrichos TaxID=762209 RepID=UPI0019552636
MLLMAVLPTVGAWMTLVLSIAGMLSSGFVDAVNDGLTLIGAHAVSVPWMPPLMMPAAGLSLLMLGYAGGLHMLLAAIAVLIAAGWGWLHGIPPFSVPVVSVVMTATMALLLIGATIRWRGQRIRAVAEERRIASEMTVRDERHRMAARLHDDVTNKLAFLITDLECMRSDPHGITGERLALSQRMAREALDRVHEVIVMMEGNVDDRSETIPAAAHPDARDDARDSIQDDMGERIVEHDVTALLAELDDRLRILGFEGGSSVECRFACALHADAADVLMALIRELYTNMARHARPDGGYDVNVAFDEHRVIVTACDVANAEDTHGAGTGLERLRRELAPLGGTIDVVAGGGGNEAIPGEWSVTAVIPYDPQKFNSRCEMTPGSN